MLTRLSILAPLAALLLASGAGAQTAPVISGPAGAYRITVKGPVSVVYQADGTAVITFGGATPTPDPVDPKPPVPPAPDPVDPVTPTKTAAWLVCIWNGSDQSPELADVRNSKSLDATLAPTKVVDYEVGTPDAKKYDPYLVTRGLQAPAYVFMDEKGTPLGAGTITTEAALIEASKNLR